MADPFSIIGLVSSSLHVIVRTKEWIEGIQRAPQSIKVLSGDLRAIESLLGELGTLLRSADEETRQNASRLVREAINNCEDVSRQVDKVLRPFVSSKNGVGVSTWKRLVFNFRESDVLYLRREMAACKQTLNMAIGCANLLVTTKLARRMQRVQRHFGIETSSVASSGHFGIETSSIASADILVRTRKWVQTSETMIQEVDEGDDEDLGYQEDAEPQQGQPIQPPELEVSRASENVSVDKVLSHRLVPSRKDGNDGTVSNQPPTGPQTPATQKANIDTSTQNFSQALDIYIERTEGPSNSHAQSTPLDAPGPQQAHNDTLAILNGRSMLNRPTLSNRSPGNSLDLYDKHFVVKIPKTDVSREALFRLNVPYLEYPDHVMLADRNALFHLKAYSLKIDYSKASWWTGNGATIALSPDKLEEKRKRWRLEASGKAHKSWSSPPPLDWDLQDSYETGWQPASQGLKTRSS